MSIEFRDSFAHYDSATAIITNGGKYDTQSSLSASYGTGRWGAPSKCLTFTQNTSGGYFEKVLTAQQTRIVQLAFHMQSFLDTPIICQLYDGSTKQLEYLVTTAGEIQVKRGDGTTLGTTSGLGLIANTWYHIETKSTIDNSAGAATVWVNAVSVLALTSQDTQNSANASSDRFRLISSVSNNSSRNVSIGDLIVLNTSGSAPYNDHMGEQRVECLFPNASGTTTDFSLSTGSNHAALLDEVPPNGDTDYVQSNTVGHIELLNLGALSSSSGAHDSRGNRIRPCEADGRHSAKYGGGNQRHEQRHAGLGSRRSAWDRLPIVSTLHDIEPGNRVALDLCRSERT